MSRNDEARLPLSRLHTMIAGAFRYGAQQERLGEIGTTEDAYAASEHHARKLIGEFVEAGHVQVAQGDGQEGEPSE